MCLKSNLLSKFGNSPYFFTVPVHDVRVKFVTKTVVYIHPERTQFEIRKTSN